MKIALSQCNFGHRNGKRAFQTQYEQNRSDAQHRPEQHRRLPPYMEEAGMIAPLRSETSGVRALGKVDKIYLENTNLMNQLSRKNQNLGNLRETYFLNQTKTLHTVNSSTLGDFNIDDKDFEVGSKNRGLKQIAKSSDGFVVKNDIERGYPQLISLWQLGLIY